MNTEIVHPLKHRAATNLGRFEREVHAQEDLTPAAVAVVLAHEGQEDSGYVIVTRRAARLRQHSGQWALPGGRIDVDEDTVGAALRETREEVGLELPRTSLLGLLDDYPTRSGFCITPVVLWGGRVDDLVPNAAEVAAIHRVPLSDLERAEVPHLEQIPESDRPVLSVPLATLATRIYAPTAAVLYQMREVVLRGRATRVSHYDQPRFAWR